MFFFFVNMTKYMLNFRIYPLFVEAVIPKAISQEKIEWVEGTQRN